MKVLKGIFLAIITAELMVILIGNYEDFLIKLVFVCIVFITIFPKYSHYFVLIPIGKSNFRINKSLGSLLLFSTNSRKDSVIILKHDLITNFLPKFFIKTKPGTKLSVRTHLFKEFEIEQIPYNPEITTYTPNWFEKKTIKYTAKTVNIAKRILQFNKIRNDLSSVKKIEKRDWVQITWTNPTDSQTIYEQQLYHVSNNSK